ncbi:MAG: hypothetical protein AAFM92_05970 [Pseudomonadota bacterium]
MDGADPACYRACVRDLKKEAFMATTTVVGIFIIAFAGLGAIWLYRSGF